MLWVSFFILWKRKTIMKYWNWINRYRRCFFHILLGIQIVFSYGLIYEYIPDSLTVSRGNEIQLDQTLPIQTEIYDSESTVTSLSAIVPQAKNLSYHMDCKFLGVIPLKTVEVQIVESRSVIPGGNPVGIYIRMKGVLVVDLTSFQDPSGNLQDPCKHILKKGDYIQAVNGKQVNTKEDLVEMVQACAGEELSLELVRNEERITCVVQPKQNESGVYQLGAWVRDDMAGIGTLTYIDADGNYGALGHSISDVEVQSPVLLDSGMIYRTQIVHIIKGKKGNPGELVGTIRYQQDQLLGSVTQNTENGIFGTISQMPEELSDAQSFPIGYKQDIEDKSAWILLYEDGVQTRYRIEIQHVDMNCDEKNKSILFQVTDEALLEKTGGIVQGLSGAPILQHGKWIGAVTHVLVNDPSSGYGILAEDMINNN